MTQLGLRARACAFGMVCATTLVACGGGGSGGGDSGASSNSNALVKPLNQPLGEYWSWHKGQRLVLGPSGYPYYIQTFEYDFFTFQDTGLAYVGPPKPDAADMRCDAPRMADNGDKLCVTYSVANGQLTLGDDTRALSAQDHGVWLFGEDTLTPMPDTNGEKLNGVYTSIDCYWSTCVRAWIQFTEDGRYSLDTFNTSVYTVPDFISSSVASGNSTAGSYRVEGHAMVVTPDGGQPIKVFYFRDRGASSDTVQLGETRYSLKQP